MSPENDWFQWLVVAVFVVAGVAFATHPKKIVEISRRYSPLRRSTRWPDGASVRILGVILVLLALFVIGAILSRF